MHPLAHGFQNGCRKRPMFACAACLVIALATWSLQPWWFGLSTVALGLALAWAWSWRVACFSVILCVWVVAVLLGREASARKAEHLLCGLPESLVQAVVLEDAHGSVHRWSVPVRLVSPMAGRLVQWQGSGPLPLQASRLEARGRFQPLPTPRNPGELDRAAWWRMQGRVAVFQQADVEARIEDSAWVRGSAAVRHGFRDRLTAGLEEESVAAQVIRAVVLGEKPMGADELIEMFRLSGSLHVFSVSGLHVSMVGLIGWGVLGACGVSRRWAVCVLLPLMFGYAWLTGGQPPAMRAAWMAAVFLGAFLWRRPPDLLNALGAVLLVNVLWDPRFLQLPGVQLSYGVVAAIGVGVPWMSARLRWLDAPEKYLPLRQVGWWRMRWWRFRQWLAQSLSVSLTAGMGASPLSAWHFGLLTPVSVIASLVLVPMVFLLVLLAMLSVSLSFLSSSLSRGVNHLNGALATAMVASADACARMPGAYLRVGHRQEPSLLVYALDRGDGAACFTGGGGSGVLLDCGGRWSFRQHVMPSLRRLGIEPDSVVLSHPDAGHLGGGAPVWRSFPVKQALLPVSLARSPSFLEWLDASPADGVSLGMARVGQRLPLADGAWLEVLHVASEDLMHATADQRVMVSRLHWRGWSWLWTSDAGIDIEQSMLESGMDLSADVILAGQSPDAPSLSDAFLHAVSPRMVVSSGHASRPLTFRSGSGVEWIHPAIEGGLTFTVDASGALCVDGCASGKRWKVAR